jgi:hypothetical protein
MDVMGAGGGRLAMDMPDELLTGPIEASVRTPELEAVPRVLRASLVAPYVDGVLFVHRLRRAGGWKAVDAAWRSPPQTTEQLLHPLKYAAAEPPESVPLPPPPKTGQWNCAYRDVFGEEGLRIALETWLSRRGAANASEGWAGDRAVLYRSAGFGGDGRERFAVAWRVRFDPAGEHDRVAFAKRAFRALYKGLHRGVAGHGDSFCSDRGGTMLAVVRSKRDLVIGVGPYEHVSNGVRSRVDCAQTTAWLADILKDTGT